MPIHAAHGVRARRTVKGRRLLLAIAALLAAGGSAGDPVAVTSRRGAVAGNGAAAKAGVPITVEARRIAAFDPGVPDRRRFGQVEFLGGLVLRSPFARFGGLSALRVAADGEHFVSLTDKGWWLTGRIVYDGGAPSGIADVVMAPMLGPGGGPLDPAWRDTESLAERGGWLYVGIEGVNRIVRFDFARMGVAARAQVVPAAPGIAQLPRNKGLEALAFAPVNGNLGGALLAFSERGLDGDGQLRAFVIGGPTPGEFRVRRRDSYDISDSVTLPSGRVLLLERRFTWWSGIAIRLRTLDVAGIAPGAVVDGADLLVAGLGYEIDNMEGVSAHTNGDGAVVLTMISDDNFSILQRTLLLQFKLVEEDRPPGARP